LEHEKRIEGGKRKEDKEAKKCRRRE